MASLREINGVSVFIRLLLAVICGGILGLERGKKRRPAGLRTYILVCTGAALTMLTNQYVCTIYSGVDPTRMGAQVISGIGFLGAGTIILTGSHQVKGLTTAAGLWAAAAMGLAIGIGFYEGAILGCIFIFMVMNTLHRFDDYVTAKAKLMEVYIEFEGVDALSYFLKWAEENELRVTDLQMVTPRIKESPQVAIVISLRLKQKYDHAEILNIISQSDGIHYIKEI